MRKGDVKLEKDRRVEELGRNDGQTGINWSGI